MIPTPELHAVDFFRSAKVVAVAMLAGPPLLTGPLAGLPTNRPGAIALAILRLRFGNEELATAAAFASGP